MNSFPLKIVTPDGLQYDGQAEELIVRTTSGDIGILAGHINCVAPLGMGRATIVSNGETLSLRPLSGRTRSMLTARRHLPNVPEK